MIEPAECANVIRQADSRGWRRAMSASPDRSRLWSTEDDRRGEQPTSAAVENDDRAASVDAVAGGEFVDDRIRL